MGCGRREQGKKKAPVLKRLPPAVTTVQEAVDTAHKAFCKAWAAELSGVHHGMGVARLIFDDIKDKEAAADMENKLRGHCVRVIQSWSYHHADTLNSLGMLKQKKLPTRRRRSIERRWI